MMKLKPVYLFVIIFFLFFSCSEEELKLEIYSPEAFAFQLENDWELNASAQIKGFQQVEENEKYISKLSYYANLITPEEELLQEVDYGMIDRESDEKLTDIQLEIQIILDESFQEGEYSLQIFVNDDQSGQQDSTAVKFKLEN
ncbi:MAG: hypothetical protein U5K00_09210 [Melioribacteraceae bacterium]|nr:hypothetical protein [Melioribacteraceae bacterium]